MNRALFLWNWSLSWVWFCRASSGEGYIFNISNPKMWWKRRERELTLHSIWFKWSGNTMLPHVRVVHWLTHCSNGNWLVWMYSGVCLIDNSEGVMQQRQIQKGGSHYGEKQLFKRWKISSLPSDWVLVRYIFTFRFKEMVIGSTKVNESIFFVDL